MTRIQVAKFTRWLMHLHYAIRTEGGELLRDGHTHLVLPNHPAYVEPVMLCAEFPNVILRPMADESFFRKPISRWALNLAGAIIVPDLPATSADNREQSVAKARQLTATALQALANGDELLFYPSGHIRRKPVEHIGNRRLAYEVCQGLFAPENKETYAGVRVIMLRTTGLDDSWFSKQKTRPTLRRHVTMHFEDMTDSLREWSKLERRAFNEQLENWYNQPE
ncbi:MAG: 1-acyl-sn-glycerol-3-phosphate acyltransferase [Paludibacteraceae bacterium]|nr:1-acyl-sn-glycerol-3-phosphate acyltransferase [Paludibacteraceae bacterium]